jgi:hypothetical protein
MSKEIKDKQVELDGIVIPYCEEGGEIKKLKNSEIILENNKTKKTGEIKYNKRGSKMTIIEYVNYNNITVEFESGYKTKTTYNSFKNGILSSPYDKTICGIGVVGLENIYPNINEEYKKSYNKWRGMITRCYNEKFKEKHITYKDCSVCEEWLFYPNFKKWYDDNYYEVDNELMCLDKDILHKGNKIYSPDTCLIVPERINTLFVQHDTRRGELPVGVNYKKKQNKYIAQCCCEDYGNAGLGTFNNPIDAFYKYKDFKERYIRIIANEYEDRIPKILFDAMYNWKINIDD